jgi:2-oxoisovalerate dehydrogenase E1 component
MLSTQQDNRINSLLNIYKYMIAARESDIVEAELVNSGEANFLASGKGHEGAAILSLFLNKDDYLHCHYRDKALMMARGISSEMFLYSALAKAQSHSAGRQMVSHMSARELNILSIVGPVGNNALQATGIAHVIKKAANSPIVLCAIGDGTSQQGEVMEAIAEAKRSQLPVLFFIHNNNLAISTRTKGKTFFSLPNNNYATSFYDIPISYINGIDSFSEYDNLANIIESIRNKVEPQIVIFNVDRLDNHSNADDQKLYRSNNEINNSYENDPLLFAEKFLLTNNIAKSVIAQQKSEAIKLVRDSLSIARNGTNPQPCYNAEKNLIANIQPNATEYRGDFNTQERYTMLEAMRATFNHHLQVNNKVIMLGQDIEDNKGDVFGVTKGLSTKYPNRVINSALSESTIAGVACGMALANQKPIAFIQFADFMPLAYNQIFTEIATMYWRTNGSWNCPVVIFAACGAYRPGLGPFHSQTNEATFAHIPGLDVFMPSNASDATGLLNAIMLSDRPSLFLYPKKLLNNASIQDTTSKDIAMHIVPIGKARIARKGDDITLVGWGNTVSLCIDVANMVEKFGINAEVIDLRTIKPYDRLTIIDSVKKTKNLIVVHEDNLTCGLGGDIIATVIENCHDKINASRITRADTYTPCNFTNQLEVLPSVEKIINKLAEFLNWELVWEDDKQNFDSSIYEVPVIGASPSDESVIINEICVTVGQNITIGEKLVDIEASKSAGEILSPIAGIVIEINVKLNSKAIVGSTLLKIKIADSSQNTQQKSSKNLILTRRINLNQSNRNNSQLIKTAIGINIPSFQTGSRLVKNEELLKKFSNYSNEDILKRTGISQRYWLDQHENIIDLGATVVTKSLEKNNLRLSDINLIICATSSPDKYQTPSTACLILNKLYETYGEQKIASYDLNAACSGYIYGLQTAKDYLTTRPNQRVLLITIEYLSQLINKSDFDTAFLFGDAVSATIISSGDYLNSCDAILNHTYITAIGENGDTLNIPAQKNGTISLQGKKLFNFAVKTMADISNKICEIEGIHLNDIDLIIPHQANQRIIEAIERRLNLSSDRMYSNICNYGNTSSCTIPIAINEALTNNNNHKKILLSAFGGGFTAGSALLTMI